MKTHKRTVWVDRFEFFNELQDMDEGFEGRFLFSNSEYDAIENRDCININHGAMKLTIEWNAEDKEN